MWCLLSISQSTAENPYDFLYTDYQPCLAAVGIRTIPILNTTPDISPYFDDLPVHGLILSGGNDLSAEAFPALEETGGSPAPERDRLELALVRSAIERSIPILGICRGMQFLNAFFGGGLTRRLSNGATAPHVGSCHSVDVSTHGTPKIFDSPPSG